MISFVPHLLIDGELTGVKNGASFPNIDPYTEELIGQTPDAGVDDLEGAILAARRAFDETGWRHDHSFRAHCLRQLRTGMLRRSEELRELLIAEVGCTVTMTRAQHLDGPIADLAYWAELTEDFGYEAELPPAPGMQPEAGRLLLKQPWGVAALITPYNYPISMFVTKVAPALGAGNAVVLKPSPLTSWTAAMIAEIIAEETDVPAGVFNLITSSSDAVAAALVAHPAVDMVSFTGSTAVGKSIMAAAANNVTKVVLELGGKSAHIVLDDADLDEAVRFSVLRVTQHAGQGCSNLTRLLLPRSHYEHGLVVARETWPQIIWGDPRDEQTRMGPLVNEASRQRVLGHISRALDEGGRLVAGGGVPAAVTTGYFVDATVIADVAPFCTLAQQETFGPVLAVMPYDTDEDAVRIANNSIYGLSGAVTGGSVERALGVARRVQTGMMAVNGGNWFARDTPFGGVKQSGIGKEWGAAGFQEFLQTRVIAYPADR